MIYGPMSLQSGIRIAVLAKDPKNTNSKEIWVKFATVMKYKNNSTIIEVQYDDGTLTRFNVMKHNLIGILKPKAPMLLYSLPLVDAKKHIKIMNTNIDSRTVVSCKEHFDNITFESNAIYKTAEDSRNTRKKPILIYPKVLRFEIGDIVRGNFLLEKFEVRRTDTEGFAKILKKKMMVESIGNIDVLIPTYSVLRSYIGISTKDWNQVHKIRDVKIEGKQTMSALSVDIQQHIKKQFFDPFFRG